MWGLNQQIPLIVERVLAATPISHPLPAALSASLAKQTSSVAATQLPPQTTTAARII
ncbi:hypothetical protein HZU75_08410 [Chitinibacter fontanus]|uniref:Uncharacterized protein n=1 Tax=Chitinibacter fontanus TaxID=1737446 RepID=A0A7D5ZGL3_9NEIS|nr:hypothetical protein [Chitinibacter fontanus]QLI81549.1 hypothetical protein HZU75_08410 [Chitinibacter fontanus]